MNAWIQFLNAAGDAWSGVAWPWLWQSSLLIAVLLAVDGGLRRRLRPALRHALWLLVPAKLLLPPTLALPTGIGYWVPRGTVAESLHGPLRVISAGRWGGFASTDRTVAAVGDSIASPGLERVSWKAAGVLSWGLGSVVLVGWLGWRMRQLRRVMVASTEPPSALRAMLDTVRAQLGCQRVVRLGLVDDGGSPALCGLFRPMILLPRGLVNRLTSAQLRSVLLHECAHARRGDVWIHAVQTLLQIVWWWHPLVWLANARLRAVREEAVDDTVAYALGPEADEYPVTLLEVAKAAVFPRGVTLGLVGIFESRSMLRQRIERLLSERPSIRPGLGWRAVCGVAALGLVMLPMARGRSAAPDPSNGSPELPSVQPAEISHSPVGVQTSYRGPSWLETNAAGQVVTMKRARFAVQIEALVKGLEGRSGRSLGEDSAAWGEVLLEQLRRGGVSTTPSNRFELRFRTAEVDVEVPEEQFAKVESVLRELSGPAPVQILVDTGFYEVPDTEFRALDLERVGKRPAGSSNAWLLDEAQLKSLTESLRQRTNAGVNRVGGPRVTTLSGRGAEITMSPGGTNVGPSCSLQVLPTWRESTREVQLDTVASMTQIVEPIAPAKARDSTAPAEGAVHSVHAIGYVERRFTNSVAVPDGFGLLVGELGNRDPKQPWPELKRVLVIVRPYLIDAAGNPIRSGSRE